MSKNIQRVYIGTEDKYGCNTILSATKIKQLGMRESDNYKVILESRNGSRIFYIPKRLFGQGEKYKYIILVFDLDSIDLDDASTKDDLSIGERMLLFSSLCGKFEDNYNDPKKKGINITHPQEDDYLGNRVVLIPVFFCFESLFLYCKKLISEIPRIEYFDYERHNRVIIDHNFTECLLSFFNIYSHETPQKIIKYISEYAIYNRFYEAVSKNIVTLNTIHSKNTQELLKQIKDFEREKKTVNINTISFEDELINSIINRSVFNYPFSRLMQISTDTEMDDFVNTFCFDKYKYTIRDMLDNYGKMLDWNPEVEVNYKSLSWYKYCVSNIFNNNLQNNKKALDAICDFLVESFSSRKLEYSYNKQMICHEPPSFLLPDNKEYSQVKSTVNVLNIPSSSFPEGLKF